MPSYEETEPPSPSSRSKTGAKPDSGRSRKSGGSERERKKRSSGGSSFDRDRNAKIKSKQRSSSDGPSTPGAHRSSSASPRSPKRRSLGKNSTNGPSTPGAHRPTPASPRSAKHRSSPASAKRDRNAKRGGKRSSSSTPASPGAYSTRDSGRSRKEKSSDRNAKSKIKRSSANVGSYLGAHPSSGTAEDRISRKSRRHEKNTSAAANSERSSQINPQQDVPSAYKIEVNLGNDDDRNVHAIRPVVAAASSQGLQDNQDDESSSPPRKRCWAMIIVVLLLLICGGALTAFFLTRSKEQPPMSTTPVEFIDLYEPPEPDFCIKVSQNQTTPEDRRAGLDQVDFGLTIDATLDIDGDITDTQVFALVRAIQEKLVPSLLGCTEDTINILGANRYIVADAYAKGKQIEDDCINTRSKSQCHRIFVELTVFLKDPIRLLDIIILISEKVDKQLKEEGVDDNNLKKPLGLGIPFFNVQLEEIDPLSPTTAPSKMPTSVPSIISPSKNASPPPTPEPVVGATPPPTSMLVDEGTSEPVVGATPSTTSMPSVEEGAPTAAPEREPMVSPVDGPAPSADPSLTPSRAPSLYPTLAPVSGPTPPPTSRPSAAPSVTPSLKPSLGPSGAPSLAPMVGPSPPPSTAPSGLPSLSPSLGPTVKASNSPSTKPSVSLSMNPTVVASSSTPSANPSAAPSPPLPSANPSAAPSPPLPSANPSAAPSPPLPSSKPSAAPSTSPAPTACVQYASTDDLVDLAKRATCEAHKVAGFTTDGYYIIDPEGSGASFTVYCNQSLGGYALFAHHWDGATRAEKSVVTPCQFGVATSALWQALRNTMTTGIWAADEEGRWSFVSINVMYHPDNCHTPDFIDALVGPYDDVVMGIEVDYFTRIFLYDEGCAGAGSSTSIGLMDPLLGILPQDFGAALFNNPNNKFETWAYPGEDRSYTLHNEIKLFIK